MKKHNYLNKSKKILLTTMAIPLVVSALPMDEVFASTNIPSLNAYESNGKIKLEWATEILPENVLYRTGFETRDMLPGLSFGNIHGNGGQSYITENGSRYISATDTIKNGNLYYAPQTSNDWSAFMFYDNFYIQNGTMLSVSFNARSKNATVAEIRKTSNSHAGDRPIIYGSASDPLKYKTAVDFTQTDTSNYPKEIEVYYASGKPVDLQDGQLLYLATGTQYRAYNGIYYRWSSAKQRLIPYDNVLTNVFGHQNHLPLNEKFTAGANLNVLGWVGLGFPSRKIETDNTWRTYNVNVEVNSDNYDYFKNGFASRIDIKTDGTLDIDDLTFGYATEVEVYRDGQSIYKGYLSDFEDKTAKDITKPNKVKKVNTSIDSKMNVTLNLEKPEDNGTTYNYQIQSIAKNGTRSSLSNPESVELKTEVKSYKYSISKSKDDVPTISISTNDFSIPMKLINLETDYLHVQAIDTNGNVGDVESFKIKDIINTSDLQKMYDKLKEIEKSNSYEDFIDFIDELEGLYGDNLPQDLKEMINQLGQHHGVNTSFLLLEEGEFTLKTSDIDSFGKVKLTAKKQTITTKFLNDFGVIDARGTQEGWNVTVSATPFTVETFDGFIGTPHQLPVGSLALNNVTGVEQIGQVHNSQLPEVTLNALMAIDGQNTTVNLLNASQGKGMGEFKFSFGDDALALTVDAVTAKIDTVNYPDQNTPYTSTVTWNLVSGPQL